MDEQMVEPMNEEAYNKGRAYADEIIKIINQKVSELRHGKDDGYIVDYTMGIQDGLASIVWDADWGLD